MTQLFCLMLCRSDILCCHCLSCHHLSSVDVFIANFILLNCCM